MSENSKAEQIFRKLAHFRPSISDDFGNQILDYLILDALSTFGVLYSVSPSEIKEYISDLFLVYFEESEIVSAAKRLEVKGCIKVDEPQNKWDYPRYSIAVEISQKINENVNNVREIENQVFDEWKQELIRKYKNNPIVNRKIDEIVDCFKEFLSSIFYRHGIECVNLLYPDNTKAQKWLDDVKGSIIDSLPKHEKSINSVIRIEFPIFFQKQDKDRRFYLYQLLNSSFFWHLIQVDETCSELFRDVIKGQKLFLDNNILYHLVGINGKNVLTSTHKILKFAQELGYELWVSTKTLEEFYESLIWNMKQFKSKIPVPADLAKMAVECLGEQSFLTAYWNEFVTSGLTIEEFVAEKSNIDNVLKGLGINVSDEYKNEIEDSQELLDEESLLSGVTIHPLNPNVLEHDAFHKLLIERIRGGLKYHMRNAVAWFLTSDSKLPIYDRVSRKGRNSLPFCITTTQWIQVNRPFLSRTSNIKDLEESFHVLVTLPYLRAMTSSLNLDSAYQDVLGKLSKFERMNPQLAFQIIADSHFMYTISQEEDCDVSIDKLESKFVDIADQLRIKNEEQESKFQQLESDYHESKVDYQKTKDMMGGQIKNIQDELAQTKKEKSRVKADAQRLTQIIKWLVFIIFAVPSSILLWTIDISSLQFNFSSVQLIIVKFLGQILLIALALLIPLKKHWKFLLGTVGMAIIGQIVNIFLD